MLPKLVDDNGLEKGKAISGNMDSVEEYSSIPEQQSLRLLQGSCHLLKETSFEVRRAVEHQIPRHTSTTSALRTCSQTRDAAITAPRATRALSVSWIDILLLAVLCVVNCCSEHETARETHFLVPFELLVEAREA